jgi:phage/plasmid-like protein (TIGR03299 family)
MTRESDTWLRNNILRGNVATLGPAWWNTYQGMGTDDLGRPNHFDGPVPIERVRELQGFPVYEGHVITRVTTADGEQRVVDDRKRKVIVRGDTLQVLGVFRSQGYQVHDFNQWLLTNVETILDGGLAINSAGLLEQGAVAWVQVALPDTREVEGLNVRTWLAAVTSLNGSYATSYLTGTEVIECDNTLHFARAQADAAGQRFKVRHTRNSLDRVQEVRDALGLVIATSDDVDEAIRELAATKVTDDQFMALAAELYGADAGASPVAQTKAANRLAVLNHLWTEDERAAAWRGTALGALQAVNTYQQHEVKARGDKSTAERNAELMVSGKFAEADAATLSKLAVILAA